MWLPDTARTSAGVASRGKRGAGDIVWRLPSVQSAEENNSRILALIEFGVRLGSCW